MTIRIVVGEGEPISKVLRRLRKKLELSGTVWEMRRRGYAADQTQEPRARRFKKRFKARQATLLAQRAGKQPFDSGRGRVSRDLSTGIRLGWSCKAGLATGAIVRARKVLSVSLPGLALLVGIALVGLWWRPWSSVNGGPEDPAVRDVERVGGVCLRASHVRRGEPVPDYAREVEGDPVVEVKLGADFIVIRRGADAGRPRSRGHVTDAALAQFHLLAELR